MVLFCFFAFTLQPVADFFLLSFFTKAGDFNADIKYCFKPHKKTLSKNAALNPDAIWCGWQICFEPSAVVRAVNLLRHCLP